MEWKRLDEDAIRCDGYVIRRGWYIGGMAFRLFHDNRLVAICPSAERAKGMAERGDKR